MKELLKFSLVLLKKYLFLMLRRFFSTLWDNLLTSSISFQIAILFLVSFAVILFGAYLTWDIFQDFGKAFWWSLNHVIDPGNLADDEGLNIQIIGFVLVLLGLGFFGLFISALTNYINLRLEEIRKGKRPYYGENHIVILGWNEGIYTLLEEIYYENPKNSVVILSDKDKEEIANNLKLYRKFKKVKFPKIYLRKGSIDNLNDIERLNLIKARAIIILDEANFKVSTLSVKSVYAILKYFHTHNSPKNINVSLIVNQPVFEELYIDLSNEIVRIIPVNYEKYLGRLAAFAVLYPQLVDVYYELFSYKGSEIYIIPVKEIGNFNNFLNLLQHLENAIPLGIYRAGKIHLVPSKDFKIQKEDNLIILQEHRNSYKFSKKSAYEHITLEEIRLPKHEGKVLCLGLGDKVKFLTKNLETLLDKEKIETIDNKVGSVKLSDLAKRENTTLLQKFILDFTKYLQTKRNVYETIVLLSDVFNDSEWHDTLHLITISCIQKVYKNDTQHPKIVAEFENPRNANIAQAEVVVLSSILANMLLLQTVLDPRRIKIFEELLTIEGKEIVTGKVFFKPNTVKFKDLLLALYKEKNILVLGFIKDSGEIILNPPSEEKVKSGWEYILLEDFH